MSFCPNCRQPILTDDIYCGSCGSQLSPQGFAAPPPPPTSAGGMITCPTCGFMNEPDSWFCERDGTSLQKPIPREEPRPPPQPSAVVVLPDKSEIRVTQPIRIFGRSDFLRQLKPESVNEVSRAHFTITRDASAFYIQDGGADANSPNGWKPSLNRTSVNGALLDAGEKRKLNNDDIIDVASLGLNLTFKTR